MYCVCRDVPESAEAARLGRPHQGAEGGGQGGRHDGQGTPGGPATGNRRGGAQGHQVNQNVLIAFPTKRYRNVCHFVFDITQVCYTSLTVSRWLVKIAPTVVRLSKNT
jgi:hypothetical protein